MRFRRFLRCERTLHTPETFQLSRRQWWTRENTRSSLLGGPLFCAEEPCADLRVVVVSVIVVHEGQFFLKNGARNRASDVRRKHHYTMSGSYCCYYSHHAIVITTIVTTVVTENRMPTHAIFFLMSFFFSCRMRDVGQQFFLKIPFILPIGIHNDSETIAIPFTTTQRYNHR